MNVKHHHNCMLCNQQKTCFVFSFSQQLSMCRSCYDILLKDFPSFSLTEDVCSFCEKDSGFLVTSFPDSVFFFDPHMCASCKDKIVSRVESSQ